MLNLVILISGNGSNLQAIMDAIDQDGLPARILAVISNRAEAFGLERARQAKIPACVIPHGDYPRREHHDEALAHKIRDYAPDLIILAGYMRILSARFIQHFSGRILNIHPSLLPEFRGTDTHQRVLESGATEHGATVHVVTEALDDGPIIQQARIPVLPQDDIHSLAARVLAEEHQLYPLAILSYGQSLGLVPPMQWPEATE